MRTPSILAALALVLSGGCSMTDEPGPSVSDHGRRTTAGHRGGVVDATVEFLRSTTAFEFAPYDSPTALALDVDVAAVGTVMSVEAAEMPTDPGLDPRAIVVVGMEVETWWSAASDRSPTAPADRLYFWFTRPSTVGAKRYEAGLRFPGVRVAVLGSFERHVITGRSSAGKVVTPAPQGLMIADGNEVANVWGEDGAAGTEWASIATLADLGRSLVPAMVAHRR